MGLGARIAFRGIQPAFDWCISKGNEVKPLPDHLRKMFPDATHYIYTGHRYYGIGYERGPWPILAGILMELMQDPRIEKVWYGADEHACEMTPDLLIEMTRHYLENGDRPYNPR